MDSINARIAEELGVRPQQVAAAVALLDEGAIKTCSQARRA